ncbi:MAG TPA: dipeptidyl aminopeptidase, partial [Mycobacteriales bacterium]|nr:dipeptidyl aminopeptidase [Mycobacteriales bacterium]
METTSRSRFFTSEDFEAAARSAIGRAGFGGPDIGLVLATLDRIADGDAAGWYAAWLETADQLRAQAISARAGELTQTAAWYYLAASDAYSRVIFFVDGMPDDSVLVPTFRRSRECWDAVLELSAGRHLPVAVPYEGGTLPGYLFRPDDSGTPRPTLVITNGSDGSLAALWAVIQPALERGWNAFAFDGPGQQAMLFERDVPFRPDWEAALTPVVDTLVERSDVDAAGLLAYGVSQGGYWLPRAL